MATNMLITNYDNSQIFVFNNRFASATYTNSTYSTVTLNKGTLLGKISSTGKIVPLASGASDGSQYPVGVLTDSIDVEAGASVVLSYCVSGDVVADKIILSGSDTMSTVISGRSIFDRIGADTVGIKLVDAGELTKIDNQ